MLEGGEFARLLGISGGAFGIVVQSAHGNLNTKLGRVMLPSTTSLRRVKEIYERKTPYSV